MYLEGSAQARQGSAQKTLNNKYNNNSLGWISCHIFFILVYRFINIINLFDFIYILPLNLYDFIQISHRITTYNLS